MISSYWFKPLLAHIDLNQTRVLALDLRGFGHSSYNTRVESISDFADDIAYFCEVLGLTALRPTIIGWSLGGCVVMALASKYPNLTNRFVLVASASVKGFPLYSY
jgi:pimeloyl-ACP methyl ester carboxylesterase